GGRKAPGARGAGLLRQRRAAADAAGRRLGERGEGDRPLGANPRHRRGGAAARQAPLRPRPLRLIEPLMLVILRTPPAPSPVDTKKQGGDRRIYRWGVHFSRPG